MQVGVRHREVAGQDVEQRRDVGRALDAGVPAQRHDAAAGTADVAQQGLQDRGRADDLRADAVVGPADGVAERGGALAPAVAGQRVGDLRELLRRDAADLLHHLGGVAGEVPLEDLEDAARVLQRLVAVPFQSTGAPPEPCALGLRRLVRLVGGCGPRRPARRPAPCAVVRGRAAVVVLVVPGRSGRSGRVSGSKPENSPSRSSVSWNVSSMIVGRVGVRHDVLTEVEVVAQHVVDQPAEERDVGAGPDRHVQVGDRRGAGEPRVDVDDRRARDAWPPSPTGSRPGGPRPCSSPR